MGGSHPEMIFFTDGLDTPTPVSKLVYELEVRTDNAFYPSAQCTEAANKVRRLIFMIRRSFQDLSKLVFICFNGAFVYPHLEYGMPACLPNLVAYIHHLGQIQRLATRLVNGIPQGDPKFSIDKSLPYYRHEKAPLIGVSSLISLVSIQK